METINSFSTYIQSVLSKGSVFLLYLLCLFLCTSVFSAVIQIDSIEELQKIGNDAAYTLNGEYELTQDIDASDTINWNNGAGFKPIGAEGNPFVGKFDGKGYKITDLYIYRSGETYIGLFGYLGEGGEVKSIKLENCWIVGNYYVGCLVGHNVGSITSSYSTGVVWGSSYVGGLVGDNVGSITSSYSTGAVRGTGISLGGLVGENNGGSIANSYSMGPVTGGEYAGGFVGKNIFGGNITKCYSTGAVSGISYTGGFTAKNDMSSITSSYYDGETSGHNYSIIEGVEVKTTAEMKQQITFVDWDFENIWAIKEEESYPYLRELGPTQGSTELAVETREINSLEELCKIGRYPDYPWWWNYELMVDIDASETVNWDGGKGFKPLLFAGEFDGNGHAIRNLYINRNGEDNVGLFACVALGGKVHDIGLKDCRVAGNSFVGGLVGYNYSSSIENSYSIGTVLGTKGYVGGIVGVNWYSNITDSYSTGTVSGTGYIGGLVGYSYTSSIKNSYSTGTVSGTEFYTGGLVGASNSGSIMNSYSMGTVSGTWYVGGLVGNNYKNDITNSYSAGTVSGTGNYVGGFIGYNDRGYITSSYWDTETSGQSSSSGGEGRTTAEMKQQATYVDWDFVNTWGIEENNSYSYLLWQGGSFVTCPDVAGMTRSSAESAITEAGLTVGLVIQQCSDTVPIGNVISQNPALGQDINPNMKVDLTVSTGTCPESEGTIEGTVEGEGVIEGIIEGTNEGTVDGSPDGAVEGEGIVEGIPEGTIDGSPDGVLEGEGTNEGLLEGEGAIEGTVEGEGAIEGIIEGTNEGTVDGNPDGAVEGEGIIEGAVEGIQEGIVEGTGDGAHEGTVEGEVQGNEGPCGCSGGKDMPSFDGFMKYLLDILFVSFLVSLMSGIKRQSKP